MNKMWQNLSFQMKISVLVSILSGFILLTGLSYHWLVNEVRDSVSERTAQIMLEGYKNELRDLVDSTALSLSAAVKETSDERQIYHTFNNLIREVRFFPDNSGYYFIYKLGGISFVHAAQPQLEGKNLINFQDSQGKLLIAELDKVSRTGGGFVEYMWEKPEKGLQPKLSYARMIPGTSYWIGTGIYIDPRWPLENPPLVATPKSPT